jgi:hypothetical protein
MAMKDDLVTIATYPNAAEAEIVHGRLSEEDIPAFVNDVAETLIPVRGVQLQVPEESVKRATRVLEEVRHHREQRHEAPVEVLPGDRLAARALNIATLGLFLVPIVLHLFSALVLVRLWWSGAEMTPKGRQDALGAWKIDRLILGCALIVVAIVALLLFIR